MNTAIVANVAQSERIVLVGAGSFIAQHVATEASKAHIPVLALRHDAPLEGCLARGDVVINFGLSSEYKSQIYNADADCDLRVAAAASKADAGLCLLSTRRVYNAAQRWGAKESCIVHGDETFYGRNKCITEQKVTDVMNGKALVLRLSNVFGYEYAPGATRPTFLGRLLAALKSHDRIIFDMHSDTRRDFLSVEDCARGILRAAMQRATGVLNLGSGTPLRCGDLAEWILAGFGRGEIVVTKETVEDEFYLDTTEWNMNFPESIPRGSYQQYCMELGRRLRDA